MDLILIETPLREEVLTKISYQNVLDKIGEDLGKMNRSNNYEEINVHYGVQSKTEYNHNERVLKRKK